MTGWSCGPGAAWEGPLVDEFGLLGATIEGKYAVESVVAEGGFGVVYRAVHLALGREVAVKVLKTPDGMEGTRREEFIQQFAAEAKTIARLDHPSIVQVLDFGSADMPSGEPAAFMVLEWLTGKTLQDALTERRGRGGRTPAEALGLLRDVIEAVASAHEAGIAHRDLKPANIMLVSARRGPAVRLLDFGIAKVMAPDEQVAAAGTRTPGRASRPFSPHYASPEQVEPPQDRPVDGRARPRAHRHRAAHRPRALRRPDPDRPLRVGARAGAPHARTARRRRGRLGARHRPRLGSHLSERYADAGFLARLRRRLQAAGAARDVADARRRADGHARAGLGERRPRRRLSGPDDLRGGVAGPAAAAPAG